MKTTTRTFTASSLISPLPPRRRSPNPTDQAIKLIVPFPPGGAVDVNARTVQPASPRTSADHHRREQTGASGMIGADSFAHAAPDGYTVLVATWHARDERGHLQEGALQPRDGPGARDADVMVNYVLVVHPSVRRRTWRSSGSTPRRTPASSPTDRRAAAARSTWPPSSSSADRRDITHVPYKGTGALVGDSSRVT